MPTRYARDDDWGDWMHEQRKQKALDKRWDAMAAVTADFVCALTAEKAQPDTFHSFDTVCPRCGAKEGHLSRKPMERAEYSVVCDRCTEG